MPAIREDQFQVTMTLDGRGTGVWDVVDGGDVGSESTKYRPGGLGGEVSLGGPQTSENITLRRAFDPVRDGALYSTLRARRGKGSVVVTQQPLDRDGNATGSPIVDSGTVERVGRPQHDSNANGVAMIEVEISVTGS